MRSILVIGGGFAGLHAALAARRVGDREISVSLLSREPWLTVRPRLYERDPESLRADLLEPLGKAGAQFVAGECVAVQERSVGLADGTSLSFDRLIVASGSLMRRPAIAGARACHSIDDWTSAIAFDRRLAAVATAAVPRVVVVGAGSTGVELALELRDRIAAHGAGEVAERARITLIDRAQHVGAELGEGPRAVIERALAEARVDLRLGSDIAELSASHVAFADGRHIDCDIVVLCTGLMAAPLAGLVAGKKDRFGRVVVDAYLRASEAPGVFVAGDACRAIPEPGRETLMSCQHALTLGKFAGENAARSLLGIPLIEYRQPRYVTCVDLGRSGAVFSEGWERIPKLVGSHAKAIKTEINTRRIYPPSGTAEEVLAASRIDDGPARADPRQ